MRNTQWELFNWHCQDKMTKKRKQTKEEYGQKKQNIKELKKKQKRKKPKLKKKVYERVKERNLIKSRKKL